MTKKIIIHTNTLIERAGTGSCYDYAFYIREFLNIEPIIFYSKSHLNRQDVIDRFKKQFQVICYDDFNLVKQYAEDNYIDYFYAQKYGYNDGIMVPYSKNCIHSLFSRTLDNVHGDVYALVSEWQSKIIDYQLPFVPYMINMPTHDYDFRSELDLPTDAIVIGRYGGIETFNIPFVKDAIKTVLDKRDNIYFLFLNTEKFINHPRCQFFDPIIDPHYKLQFIQTCDAFLHARDYGETFGLSVLEFATQNKQIISYFNKELQCSHPLGGQAHFLYLGDNCHKFTDEPTLLEILLNLEKNNPFDTTYLNDVYSPKQVIDQFNKVFLS